MTPSIGAYYAGGFKPIRLLADSQYVRAWSVKIKFKLNLKLKLKSKKLKNLKSTSTTASMKWLECVNDDAA